LKGLFVSAEARTPATPGRRALFLPAASFCISVRFNHFEDLLKNSIFSRLLQFSYEFFHAGSYDPGAGPVQEISKFAALNLRKTCQQAFL